MAAAAASFGSVMAVSAQNWTGDLRHNSFRPAQMHILFQYDVSLCGCLCCSEVAHTDYVLLRIRIYQFLLNMYIDVFSLATKNHKLDTPLNLSAFDKNIKARDTL